MARSARQIAQATMRDSAAMRTIAILTMLFLPGTAVAVSSTSPTLYLLESQSDVRAIVVLLQHDHVQLDTEWRQQWQCVKLHLDILCGSNPADRARAWFLVVLAASSGKRCGPPARWRFGTPRSAYKGRVAGVFQGLTQFTGGSKLTNRD
jgi:hypothetical protein